MYSHAQNEKKATDLSLRIEVEPGLFRVSRLDSGRVIYGKAIHLSDNIQVVVSLWLDAYEIGYEQASENDDDD